MLETDGTGRRWQTRPWPSFYGFVPPTRIGYAAHLFPQEKARMAAPKLNDFNERRKAAAEAKSALAAKFRAKPAPDDPIMIARRAEQQRLAEAREVRAAERRAAKEAELARLREQDEVRKAEEANRLAEIARREAEKAAEAIRMAAERKAIRDAKYAARKARGGKK